MQLAVPEPKAHILNRSPPPSSNAERIGVSGEGAAARRRPTREGETQGQSQLSQAHTMKLSI